ncbi:MAG: phenylalanine--tRNA ligase subunit beta [Gemmatimonadales bacterium]
MKVSRRWLEAFLRRPLEAREVGERLTMLGAPLEGIAPIRADLGDVVIGLVEAVRPHPNADWLRLCTVNAGGPARLNVVCGASNVEAGRKYPFAPVGASLPGGLRLDRRKIRGEFSEGMLCSARELGLGADHEGILTLETEAEPGASFRAVLGLDDEQIEIDVPPVRPDLLGHKGIARELAVAYGVQFRLPEMPGGRTVRRSDGRTERRAAEPPSRPAVPPSSRHGVVGGVAVSIEEPAACARFTGAVIRGLTVGPSPDWLRNRLEAVGLRSISNVVDATNYVMLELGQPLHAYDLAKVPGPALIVRPSVSGESLLTLDGIERQLPEGTTVVADAAGVSGVGGVMGGRSSEVGEATTDVFLESAWWYPGPLRQARRALGLPTEASHRFERGTDLWAVPEALRRCIEIVLVTAGGRLDGEPLDLWPEPIQPPRVFLRHSRVNQVLGVELPIAEIERCLTAIGAIVAPKPQERRFAVQVPGWRPDLREEIDLVEEIARIHGFDRFPDTLGFSRTGGQRDAPIARVAELVRQHMVAEGLYEVILLGVGPREGAQGGQGGQGEQDGHTVRWSGGQVKRPSAQPPSAVLPSAERRAPSHQVRVLNPISADHGFLRSSLLPGLIRQVEANWANHVRDVRLFEVGTVFSPGPPGQRPSEMTNLAAVITGGRWPMHWSDPPAGGGAGPGIHPSDCDVWDLKGLFERSVALANPRAAVQVESEGWIARGADGSVVGWAGPIRSEAPRWAAPLLGFEVVVDPEARVALRYARLPVFPAVSRDLALIVPPGVTAAAILAETRTAAGSLLESVYVVDEYRGEGLPPGPPGRRSVAIRLIFRSAERTLRDDEVDQVMQRVLNRLRQTLDLTARTG